MLPLGVLQPLFACIPWNGTTSCWTPFCHCASFGYSAGNFRAGICAWWVLACPLQPCGYGEVMAILDDVLKGGSFPLVGLGIVALAVPHFIPALRPQFAAVLKSGAKLFLEAELGADDAIVDRYVGAAIDALFQATATVRKRSARQRPKAK